MKVLMVAQHVNFFRNLETVVRELSRRGHEVAFLHGVDFDDPRATKKVARKIQRGKLVLTRGLASVEADIPGVTSGHRPKPPEAACRALRYGRQVMNRATYLRKGHPSPTRVVDILDREMPPRLASRVARAPWTHILRSKATMRLWRRIEEASPPSATLTSLLTEMQPQVVLVSPAVWPKDLVEADYIHAARCLGIPTIGYVNSWDNLTSKGTVHALPDELVVWNEPTAREAAELHLVPPEIIRITGAPHLDHFFAMRPTATREEVCAAMGCPPDRPYVMYLCSSRTLIASEVDLVTRLAVALAAQLPGQTPTLVVRPHPTNSAPWAYYQHPGVVVHPREGDQADSPDSWQQYFNQLAMAQCAFGLNSTAFLEAVVAGRPCVTIVSDEFWAAQGRTGHFKHLLAADFLEVAADVNAAVERIARIVVNGADEKREQRAAFARSFLRPCGLDRPAAQVVVDLIERSAARTSAPTERHTQSLAGPLAQAIAVRAVPVVNEWATWLAAEEARHTIATHAALRRSKTGTPLRGRVLVVVPDVSALSVLDGLLTRLSREGHRVHLAIEQTWQDGDDPASLEDHHKGLVVSRTPELRDSPWQPLSHAIRARLARHHLSAASPRGSVAVRLMAAIERRMPPELDLIEFVEELKPDVLVVAPNRSATSPDADYVRVARWLGVPSISLPLRWDDLESSHSLQYETPDLIALWYERQGAGIISDGLAPKNRTRLTGAPLPSDITDGVSVDRTEYCSWMGLDPSRRMILFEAPAPSTRSALTRFHEWRRRVKESANPAVRDAAIVVFVHNPDEVAVWRRMAETADVSVARSGTDQRRAQFRVNESLAAADVVIASGLNMALEAEARGKPVIVMPGADEGRPSELLRFCRAQDSAGPSPTVAQSDQDVLEQLARIFDARPAASKEGQPTGNADPRDTGAIRIARVLDELVDRGPTHTTPIPPSAWRRLLILSCASLARRFPPRRREPQDHDSHIAVARQR